MTAHILIELILFAGCVWIATKVFKDEKTN